MDLAEFVEINDDKKTLRLNCKRNMDLHKVVKYLLDNKDVTHLRLGYCLMPIDVPEEELSYFKLNILSNEIKTKKLKHLELLDLSNNNLGNFLYDQSGENESYLSNFPLVYTLTNIINSVRYYLTPEQNPAYSIKKSSSLMNYLGQTLLEGEMENLSSLILCHTNIGDSELRDLCNTISKKEILPNLQELDLSMNNITCVGIDYIALTIKGNYFSKLQKINLSNNRIDTIGGINLLLAFEAEKNCQIKMIDLSHNHIGDQIIQSVVKAITTLPHLVGLSLKGVDLSEEGAEEIVGSLKKSTINRDIYFDVLGTEKAKCYSFQATIKSSTIKENHDKFIDSVSSYYKGENNNSSSRNKDLNEEALISSRTSSFAECELPNLNMNNIESDFDQPLRIFLTEIKRRCSIDPIYEVDELPMPTLSRRYSLDSPNSPQIEDTGRKHSLGNIDTLSNLLGEESETESTE